MAQCPTCKTPIAQKGATCPICSRAPKKSAADGPKKTLMGYALRAPQRPEPETPKEASPPAPAATLPGPAANAAAGPTPKPKPSAKVAPVPKPAPKVKAKPKGALAKPAFLKAMVPPQVVPPVLPGEPTAEELRAAEEIPTNPGESSSPMQASATIVAEDSEAAIAALTGKKPPILAPGGARQPDMNAPTIVPNTAGTPNANAPSLDVNAPTILPDTPFTPSANSSAAAKDPVATPAEKPAPSLVILEEKSGKVVVGSGVDKVNSEAGRSKTIMAVAEGKTQIVDDARAATLMLDLSKNPAAAQAQHAGVPANEVAHTRPRPVSREAKTIMVDEGDARISVDAVKPRRRVMPPSGEVRQAAPSGEIIPVVDQPQIQMPASLNEPLPMESRGAEDRGAMTVAPMSEFSLHEMLKSVAESAEERMSGPSLSPIDSIRSSEQATLLPKDPAVNLDDDEFVIAIERPTNAIWLVVGICVALVVTIPVALWLIFARAAKAFWVTNKRSIAIPLFGKRCRTLRHEHLAAYELKPFLFGPTLSLKLMPYEKSKKKALHLAFVGPGPGLSKLWGVLSFWRHRKIEMNLAPPVDANGNVLTPSFNLDVAVADQVIYAKEGDPLAVAGVMLCSKTGLVWISQRDLSARKVPPTLPVYAYVVSVVQRCPSMRGVHAELSRVSEIGLIQEGFAANWADMNQLSFDASNELRFVQTDGSRITFTIPKAHASTCRKFFHKHSILKQQGQR